MTSETSDKAGAANRNLVNAWLAVAVVALAFSGTLVALSAGFASAEDRAGMPILALVVVLVAAGALFALVLPWLLWRSEQQAGDGRHRLLLIMIVAGIAARLILFLSTPILENDYRRYLWDGAVVAHGLNPYVLTPHDVISAGASGPLADLARTSHRLVEGIGHKSLNTIYPPAAQAIFALAHAAGPFSLNAWRALLLIGDLATLTLLLALLGAQGRSPLWAALYWLNPIVLKEGFNSAHMEPVLLPFVLFGLLLFWRHRLMAGTVLLGIAAGIKLWPVVLAPLFWRPWLGKLQAWTPAAVVLAVLSGLWLAPMLLSAPLSSAGLAAYAENWTTNSALAPALESLLGSAFGVFGVAGINTALLTRGVLALGLVAVIVLNVAKPWRTLDDLLFRATVIVTALVLLSPAQYPWYLMWTLPFLVFHPSRTLLVAGAMLPLYYMLFDLAARGQSDTFTSLLVWVIWLPVWLAAFLDWRGTAASNGIAIPSVAAGERGQHAPI